MYFRIDTTSGVPIYLQIINGIKYAIAIGSLKPGEQAPSIRDLAIKLHVNPNTVLKAYRELERENVIDVKRGMGAYVSDSGSSITQKEQDQIVSDYFDKAIAHANNFKMSKGKILRLFEKHLNKVDQVDKKSKGEGINE
jgi:GntR family transcriptional regulator